MKIRANNREYVLDIDKAIETGTLRPSIVHKIGNRYRRRWNGEEFILASVDLWKVNLISTKDGLRHADAVKVERSAHYDNLPDEVWQKVTNGDHFDLISQ